MDSPARVVDGYLRQASGTAAPVDLDALDPGDRRVHEAAHAEVLRAPGATGTAGRSTRAPGGAGPGACGRRPPSPWSWPRRRRSCGGTTASTARRAADRGRGQAPARPAPRGLPLRQRLGGLAFLKGEPGFHTEFEEWDADPYTLNCADGLLDMRTQTLRPHDPAALCTKITRWSFAGTRAQAPGSATWSAACPNPDVRRQVQRDLGRALVGADLEESLPIWYGSGANGKSTTAARHPAGLDGYGKKAARNLLVATKFERHPTELADLAGSRIVFSEEVEDGKRLDEALVKDLTGGSRQKARFMRGDNFEFEQTFSIFLLVNHRPTITGTDRGIWRRIRLVPWTVSIPFAEQRPQDEMVAELIADGAWMLRWMVAGFADWQADHHWVAEEVQAATASVPAEQDRLAGFLDRCLRGEAHLRRWPWMTSMARMGPGAAPMTTR